MGFFNKVKSKWGNRGFTQTHGVDFGEMFALVTKFVFYPHTSIIQGCIGP